MDYFVTYHNHNWKINLNIPGKWPNQLHCSVFRSWVLTMKNIYCHPICDLLTRSKENMVCYTKIIFCDEIVYAGNWYQMENVRKQVKFSTLTCIYLFYIPEGKVSFQIPKFSSKNPHFPRIQFPQFPFSPTIIGLCDTIYKLCFY